MYRKFYIGIDNGVTGTMCIIGTSVELPLKAWCIKTPVVSQQNYTKEKKNVTRIDAPKLQRILQQSIPAGSEVHINLERPFVNPKMFQATLSAIRALEATITVIETLGFPYSYIDSKEWQKALLPAGSKGDQLKLDSLEIGRRLYPDVNPAGHKDADGLLIAHYTMLKNK